MACRIANTNRYNICLVWNRKINEAGYFGSNETLMAEKKAT